MNSETRDAAGKGCLAFLVLLVLVIAFVAAGAEMMVQHTCHGLDYDTGGIHWWSGVIPYCQYEPLEVPLDELLKGAYYVPSEGTSA